MKPTKWHKVDQLVVSYFKIVLYPQKKTKQVDVKMLSHEQCVSLLFKNAPLPHPIICNWSNLSSVQSLSRVRLFATP